MRGETTDPSDLARVQTDKAAFLLRCEKLNGLMAEMEKQAVAVTQAANDCLFDETTTPIQRTVQHKPGRMMSAVNHAEHLPQIRQIIETVRGRCSLRDAQASV